MINLQDINYWDRASMGKVIQVLIMAEELEKLLIECFPPSEARYSLIAYDWDKNITFNYFEAEISELASLVDRGYVTFFLRNHKITPILEMPANPIVGGALRSDINKWLMYLGMIDIDCSVGSTTYQLIPSCTTSIGHIDKCGDIRVPSQIIVNEEYTKMFLRIKKLLSKKLHYHSILKMTTGQMIRSKKADVSDGFANAVRSGKLKLPSNLDIEW